MKLKLIFVVLCASIIGVLFGKMMIGQYDSKASLKTVFGENNNVYFLELGTYDTKEEMEKNVINFTSYIYDNTSGKYSVYIALTQNKENLSKLEGYFKNLGYIIYVREFNVDNDLFLQKLKVYDDLLIGTTEASAIKTIINQTLETYEELINWALK